MTKYNWNYESLGFKSEQEMNESIARVERKLNMTRDERVREEMKEGFARGRQPFSFAGMEEGARLEELDRVVRNRIMHEKEQAKLQAEREESQRLMKALDEHITAENE